MNMLFENLLQRIENITFEDIKFDYWDYKEEVKESDDEEQSGQDDNLDAPGTGVNRRDKQPAMG